jgi:hypothetical protein
MVMENMSRNETYERLNKNFGEEAQEAARVSQELRQAGLVRPAWYCPLLRGLGVLLVSIGTHLKTHNSTQPTLGER